MKIYDRLKEERKKLSIKQKKLAEFLNTTPQTILRYENGTIGVNAETFEKIATLGFDVQYIITGVRSDSAPLPNDEQLLLSLYRQATEDIKKATLAVAATGKIASSKDIIVSHSNIEEFTVN